MKIELRTIKNGFTVSETYFDGDPYPNHKTEFASDLGAALETVVQRLFDQYYYEVTNRLSGVSEQWESVQKSLTNMQHLIEKLVAEWKNSADKAGSPGTKT